jgi:hypothetical protein
MYIEPHVMYPMFFSDFNETWIISTHFRKVLKYQISWKSVEREPSCSMRTDARTETDRHDETNSWFSQLFLRTYKSLRQRNPNPQTSNCKSTKLTPRPRRSLARNGQKIVVRNRENFTVDFVCNFSLGWYCLVFVFCQNVFILIKF